MNVIATVPATRGQHAFLDIHVDGKPLAQHFTGRRGAHPSDVSPLGWSSASAATRAEIVAQLLGERRSELESGRVPVLVCENCGDVGCGAIVVRILRDAGHIMWTDWFYETGYMPGRPLEWQTQPGDFVFDLRSYEAAIRLGL